MLANTDSKGTHWSCGQPPALEEKWGMVFLGNTNTQEGRVLDSAVQVYQSDYEQTSGFKVREMKSSVLNQVN